VIGLSVSEHKNIAVPIFHLGQESIQKPPDDPHDDQAQGHAAGD